MNSNEKRGGSASTPRLGPVILREVVGNLVLLVPVAMLLCAGLLMARMFESHVDHLGHVVAPLTDQDAEAQLNQCPVLRGEHVLDIKDIKPYSANQTRVDYEYRTGQRARVSPGTAQFAWSQGGWHAVLCR